MESRKAIPEKHFVSEEENNCEKEVNLIPQDLLKVSRHLLFMCNCLLLFTRVSLIYLVNEFFFCSRCTEQNENAR